MKAFHSSHLHGPKIHLGQFLSVLFIVVGSSAGSFIQQLTVQTARLLEYDCSTQPRDWPMHGQCLQDLYGTSLFSLSTPPGKIEMQSQKLALLPMHRSPVISSISYLGESGFWMKRWMENYWKGLHKVYFRCSRVCMRLETYTL